MTIDPPEDQEENLQQAKDSPGSILRQARIDRGLDEKDIADRLHITVHYVKAIEGDRYEKLPGVVFAKGYLKSYAIAVGLEPEVVLQSFLALNADTTSERHQTQIRGKKRARNRNKGLQWALVSVACFTLLITTAWYFSAGSTTDSVATRTPAAPRSSSPSPSTAEPATQRQAVIDDPVSAEVAMALEPAPDSPDEAPVLGQDNSQAVVEVQTDSVIDAVTVDSSTGDDQEEQPTTPLAASAQTPTFAEPATDSENATTGPEDYADVNVLQGDNGERIIAVDAHGEDLLRIRFSGESWVEINDGDDRQIYRDLRGEGDILEVSGHAPFNILLGDAPYTSLNFNGADIDVSDNIRIDNSARLTVGL